MLLKRITFNKVVDCEGDSDAVRGGGRVLRLLGAAARAQHLVPVLPRHRLPVRGQHGGVTSAAAGLHQLLLQPHHLLLHEPQVPPGLPGHIQLVQVERVSG